MANAIPVHHSTLKPEEKKPAENANPKPVKTEEVSKEDLGSLPFEVRPKNVPYKVGKAIRVDY